jgi:hypothetical protein
MSEGIGLLLAIALMMIFFSLLLYLFQEQNPLLRLLFIMAILVSGFFVPTAVYKLRTTCETVVNTSTLVVGVTTNTYMQECFTTDDTAADTFYTIFWSIYQILILYFICKVAYMMFQPLWERMKRW